MTYIKTVRKTFVSSQETVLHEINFQGVTCVEVGLALRWSRDFAERELICGEKPRAREREFMRALMTCLELSDINFRINHISRNFFLPPLSSKGAGAHSASRRSDAVSPMTLKPRLPNLKRWGKNPPNIPFIY